MIKIIVANSKQFNDYLNFEFSIIRIIRELSLRGYDTDKNNIEIISDSYSDNIKLTERFTRKHGYNLNIFIKDSDKYVKSIKYVRNRERCDYVSIHEI